jgi:hypothetical protein
VAVLAPQRVLLERVEAVAVPVRALVRAVERVGVRALAGVRQVAGVQVDRGLVLPHVPHPVSVAVLGAGVRLDRQLEGVGQQVVVVVAVVGVEDAVAVAVRRRDGSGGALRLGGRDGLRLGDGLARLASSMRTTSAALRGAMIGDMSFDEYVFAKRRERTRTRNLDGTRAPFLLPSAWRSESGI